MNVSSNYQENIQLIHSHLAIDKSFDIVERPFVVGGRNSVLYFLNGFIKDNIMEDILKSFFQVTPETMNSYTTIDDFMNNEIHHVSVEGETDLDKIILLLLTGQTIMFVEGYPAFVILDLRTYPGADSSKPEKEKTLRGGRDGFIEKLVFNCDFIRRRIRDPRLVMEIHQIGDVSKTDVCLAFIDGVADPKVHDLIVESFSKVDINALTLSDQSLLDVMCRKNWLNPLPKIRYTERPDIASAHIVEGKIIVIVDNSPNVMILPTGFFDLLQDINDYYFPTLTGNYLRIVRNLVMLATILLTPIYLLFINGNIFFPSFFDFLKPQDYFAVPMLYQFILLEFAMDVLKLAGLNTPSPLGSTMSLIGGLILGEYTIKSGWFTNQAVLYMAIVTLGDFIQPSIEMNFAIKFARSILLILSGFFGFWGFIGGIVFIIIVMASTKTIAGDKYFYPLIPFNWQKLKRLLFRVRISNNVQ